MSLETVVHEYRDTPRFERVMFLGAGFTQFGIAAQDMLNFIEEGRSIGFNLDPNTGKELDTPMEITLSRDYNKEVLRRYAPNPNTDDFMKRFVRKPKGILLEEIGDKWMADVSLGFDDVTLEDLNSHGIRPYFVNTQTWFSRNIPLNIPVCSAAMKDVTDRYVAVEMAKCGGIGVIPNLDTENQVKEIEYVKGFLHGLIENPKMYSEDTQVWEILEDIRNWDYRFSSFPIYGKDNKLVGIVTEKELTKYNEDLNDKEKTVKQIMKVDPVKLKVGATPQEAWKLMLQHQVGSIPLVDDEGRCLHMYTYDDVMRIVEGKGNMYNIDKQGRLRVAAAIGSIFDTGKEGQVPYESIARTPNDNRIKKIKKLIEAGVDALVIDTSHANDNEYVDTVRFIKNELLPEYQKPDRYGPDFNVDVVVGNIGSPALVDEFIKAGADGIKVGIGSGATCTTRDMTGAGVGQVTAAYTVIDAVKGRVPVIIDGGIQSPGFAVRAQAIGGSCVMLGNYLAGADESPGEEIMIEGRQYKVYRGEASASRMAENKGERYHAKAVGIKVVLPAAQGITGYVPIKGPLSGVLYEFVSAMQSGYAHCGAENTVSLHQRAWFVENRPGAVQESKVRVIIGEDKPRITRIR